MSKNIWLKQNVEQIMSGEISSTIEDKKKSFLLSNLCFTEYHDRYEGYSSVLSFRYGPYSLDIKLDQASIDELAFKSGINQESFIEGYLLDIFLQNDAFNKLFDSVIRNQVLEKLLN